MSLITELKRRNVFRAGAAYVAVAWVLMQVAEVSFPAFGLSDSALRFLIIALAVGFVPAVALAWVFELTPEGVKRDRDVDPEGTLAKRTNHLVDRLIILALAIGVAYFAADKFLLDPARDKAKIEEAFEQARTDAQEAVPGRQSIVVLPFSNLSGDPGQEFFADGMAEEILNLLARIPELRVISRTSAFAFKGKDVGLAEIAEQLDVSHVLEGSVRMSGDRLRISTQLIDASNDSHLWSENYDRSLDDIFDVQDDIAARVVERLRTELLGELPKARRVDPQAYVMVMQARRLLEGHQEEGRVHELLQQALEIDPDYAHAWTVMSWLYFRCSRQLWRDGNEFCESITIKEASRRSDETLQKVLKIDPDNATAIAYAAFATGFEEGRFADAAPELERALRLDPTKTDVLRPSIIFARAIGRPEVAVRIAEYTLARDPLCGTCAYYMAKALLQLDRFDDAENAIRNLIGPGNSAWDTLASILLLRGDPKAALEILASLPEQDRQHPFLLHTRAIVLHTLGRHEDSRAALEALEKGWAEQFPDRIADVYAWIGDFDEAFKWRSASEGENSKGMQDFDWNSPYLETLLSTPRGQELLRGYGVADDQLEQIQFDVRLPGG